MSVGNFVVLFLLVIVDDFKFCFKFMLWREVFRWIEKINLGDFVVVIVIKIGKWCDEYVGKIIFNLGFYNFY